MEITKRIDGQNYIFELEGTLDTTTAPELEKAVNENFNEANSFVFDFSKIKYISSAGLRVLLTTHKLMISKGGLKITNINEMVKNVLDMTGLSSVLNIE